jgi:ribosome-associated protein
LYLKEGPLKKASPKTKKRLSAGEKLATKIRDIGDDRKGEDILVLDVRKHSPITDYLVIMTGNSSRHVDALADNILLKLKNEENLMANHVEGRQEASWVLLDYGDVIVHLFQRETRHFYNIERLWGDAPHLS